MDSHFCASLHQLKLQLDVMNQRTAALLNRQPLSHHSDVSLQGFSARQVDTSACDSSSPLSLATMSSNIRQISAMVDTLAIKQETALKQLHTRLETITEQLDDFGLNHPHLTPPETPVSTVQHEPQPGSQHYSSPVWRPTTIKPSATVEDVGGYFDPHDRLSSAYHNSKPVIVDVSTFVARVNRVRRTKTIANIQDFLKGSALRWYDIGLKTDGSHMFDDSNRDFDLNAFCDSLITLFGFPGCLSAWMIGQIYPNNPPVGRSVLLEDYVFRALEAIRHNPVSDHRHVDPDAILKRAVALYNKDHGSSIQIKANVEGNDLVEKLKSLRILEFKSRGIGNLLSEEPESFEDPKPGQTFPEIITRAADQGEESSTPTINPQSSKSEAEDKVLSDPDTTVSDRRYFPAATSDDDDSKFRSRKQWQSLHPNGVATPESIGAMQPTRAGDPPNPTHVFKTIGQPGAFRPSLAPVNKSNVFTLPNQAANTSDYGYPPAGNSVFRPFKDNSIQRLPPSVAWDDYEKKFIGSLRGGAPLK